jgi:hypothetical protein
MYSQKGGLDPATAALLASVTVGSVSAYGFQNESKTAEEALNEKVEARVGDVDQVKKDLEDSKKKLFIAETENKRLQREIENLKKTKEDLAKKTESLTGPPKVFQNASKESLTKAVEPTLAKLKALPQYEWMATSELNNLRKALEYPGSVRLFRPGLLDFYEKRVKPAIQKDVAIRGGARATDDLLNKFAVSESKLLEGDSDEYSTYSGLVDEILTKDDGDDTIEKSRFKFIPVYKTTLETLKATDKAKDPAKFEATTKKIQTYITILKTFPQGINVLEANPLPEEVPIAPIPSKIPTYEEFANLYAEAINEANQGVLSDEEVAKKRKLDEIAKKKGQVLVDKLKKALKKAEKIAPENSAQLLEDKEKVTAFETKASAVTSETSSELDKEGAELLKTIPRKKEEYSGIDQGSLRGTPSESAKKSLFGQEPIVTEQPEVIETTTNPLLTPESPKEETKPAEEETKPLDLYPKVGKTPFTLPTPGDKQTAPISKLFTRKRKPDSRTGKKTRIGRGGSRKRTLKKRRGGK